MFFTLWNNKYATKYPHGISTKAKPLKTLQEIFQFMSAKPLATAFNHKNRPRRLLDWDEGDAEAEAKATGRLGTIAPAR